MIARGDQFLEAGLLDAKVLEELFLLLVRELGYLLLKLRGNDEHLAALVSGNFPHGLYIFVRRAVVREVFVSDIGRKNDRLVCKEPEVLSECLILLVLELLISSALLRFNGLKRLFYGSPSIVIRRGVIDVREMRRNRMEIDELLSELRQKGFSNPSDVYYAILEDNGKLSVFPAASKAPAVPADLNLTPDEHGIAHVCVVDGRVIDRNLALVGWDRARLDRELARRSLDVSHVFVFTVDDLGQITCVKKESAGT